MNIYRNTRRLIFFLVLTLLAGNSSAKIFYSKNEAMALAFGEEAEIEVLSLFLTTEQKSEIEKLTRARLESSMFSFYVGRKNGEILGYAAIETHTVRTKPETLLVVLTPGGDTRAIHVLAFHEPPEYQPPERWFEQFYRQELSNLDFNQDIQAVSGATLSAHSALTSVRKVMAMYRLARAENKIISGTLAKSR